MTPVLLQSLLPMANVGGWGDVGTFEHDKVFVLDYGEGTINVSILHQDNVKIDAFDEYASKFFQILGRDIWHRSMDRIHEELHDPLAHGGNPSYVRLY